MERKKVTFYLLPEMAKGIKLAAVDEGVFDYQILERAIGEFLERRGAPHATSTAHAPRFPTGPALPDEEARAVIQRAKKQVESESAARSGLVLS